VKSEFPLSSARIKALKNDLSKLADVEFLKKELVRMTEEIKGFDMHLHMSPQAKRRLRTLESRFHQLKTKIMALQKQVDSEVNKIASILRRSAKDATATLRSVTSKRKATKKTSSKKASTKKAGAKKATRRTAKS
jgi:predicted RNase H-like nuclease (RuvC/YqgF family)